MNTEQHGCVKKEAAEDMLRVRARVFRNAESGGYTTRAVQNPRPDPRARGSVGSVRPARLQDQRRRACRWDELPIGVATY